MNKFICSSRPRGEQYLTRWAINQLHDIASLSRMVDPSLNGRYPEKSLSQFADIISICIQVSCCASVCCTPSHAVMLICWFEFRVYQLLVSLYFLQEGVGA